MLNCRSSHNTCSKSGNKHCQLTPAHIYSGHFENKAKISHRPTSSGASERAVRASGRASDPLPTYWFQEVLNHTTMHSYGSDQLYSETSKTTLSHETKWANERSEVHERSGVHKRSEQGGASKWVCVRGNRQTSSSVLTSRFLAVLNHYAFCSVWLSAGDRKGIDGRQGRIELNQILSNKFHDEAISLKRMKTSFIHERSVVRS